MMSFAHEAVWNNIIKKAIKKAKLKPDRADIPLSGPIPDNILDGIFNARIILVDLSPQLVKAGKIEDGKKLKYLYNWNVAYELGIAHAARQKDEVVLISQTIEKVPFDIQHWQIHQYDQNDTIDSINRIGNLLKIADRNIDDSKSRLIKRDADKLDLYCISLMTSFRNKANKDETFEIPENPTKDLPNGTKEPLDKPSVMLAIHKILDLGILKSRYYPDTDRYSYEWTEKGKAALKYLKML